MWARRHEEGERESGWNSRNEKRARGGEKRYISEKERGGVSTYRKKRKEEPHTRAHTYMSTCSRFTTTTTCLHPYNCTDPAFLP